MNIVYVLSEFEPLGFRTIAVFDYKEVSRDKLGEYYGDSVEIIEFRTVEDSGVEWEMKIRFSDGECRLVMHSYTLNEF